MSSSGHPVQLLRSCGQKYGYGPICRSEPELKFAKWTERFRVRPIPPRLLCGSAGHSTLFWLRERNRGHRAQFHKDTTGHLSLNPLIRLSATSVALAA